MDLVIIVHFTKMFITTEVVAPSKTLAELISRVTTEMNTDLFKAYTT